MDLASERLNAPEEDKDGGLSGGDVFHSLLLNAMSRAKHHDWTLAVMFLDLGASNSIHDMHTHAVADVVLKEVAKRLLGRARKEDTVCRHGGDGFLCLFIDPQGRENIERIARGVLEIVAQPIDIGSRQLIIKSSIGISVYPDHGATGEQLISNAVTALYRAKESMSRCEFFDAPKRKDRSLMVRSYHELVQALANRAQR